MPKNQIIWFSISWDSSMGCKQAKKTCWVSGLRPEPLRLQGESLVGNGVESTGLWGNVRRLDTRRWAHYVKNWPKYDLIGPEIPKKLPQMWFWSIFQINATHYCKKSRAKLSNGMLIPFLAPKLASPDLVTFDKAEIGSSTGAIGVTLLTA